MSVRLSACLSACLPVCLSVCVLGLVFGDAYLGLPGSFGRYGPQQKIGFEKLVCVLCVSLCVCVYACPCLRLCVCVCVYGVCVCVCPGRLGDTHLSRELDSKGEWGCVVCVCVCLLSLSLSVCVCHVRFVPLGGVCR